MTRNSLVIALICGWLFLCTLCYGICILTGLAYYWAALPASVGLLILLRSAGSITGPEGSGTPNSYLPLLILFCGLLLIMERSGTGLAKQGHWDAWWFWNLRAKFLTYPDHWRTAFGGDTRGTAFSTPVVHADYPPFLPLLNAMSWRWLRIQPAVVPYVWSLIALLFSCSTIFLELARRNLVVGAAALFFLGWQQHLIGLGVGQTADVWIGLFLLLAVVAGTAAIRTGDNRYWIVAGLMLGCGMWTKNEGVLVAICFLVVSVGRQPLGRLRYIAAGLLFPALAWIGFKIGIAPSNDLVEGFSRELVTKLKDPGRYLAIWNLPREQVRLYYPALPWLLLSSVLAWIFMRCRPSRYLLMLILIWAGYCATYLVSPHDIGWHINTSADRLIGQLYPTLIYLVALQCCPLRFQIVKPEALP